MVDDWLTRRATITTENAALEEVSAIVGLYLPVQMRTCRRAEETENEK